jgi:hypothetical protein
MTSTLDQMYDWPTWWLLAGLLALMFAANEAGFRIARRRYRDEPEQSRTVSYALKGSVLGLVALLLGFSFSMTTARHDVRRRLVLDEANAAGTCYLRAGLLDDPARGRIRDVLRNYLGARLEYYEHRLDPEVSRRATREMDRRLGELWAAVEDANRKDRTAVQVSQIVPAANEVIDLSSSRAWANQDHMPRPVVMVLAVCVLVSNLLIGHSSGQVGVRHTWLWVATNVLFALVLFLVLDFDRPRRGLIRVDHTPLRELQAAWTSPP